MKATIHTHQERKTERRREALAQKRSTRQIDWKDYENLIPAPESLEAFLSRDGNHAFSLVRLDRLMASPLSINRPFNIAWDGDSTALEKRYISSLQMPLDLDSGQAEHFIDSLRENAELRTQFFEWIADCIRSNMHFSHTYYEYWQLENEYDAVIGRVVTHLKQYLTLDGLHYDRIYEESCKNKGIEEWFDSPYRIVDIDSSYYCATRSIENPYRHFEVFIYRLVEEYGVDAVSLFRWLDNSPLLGENYELSLKAEAVLPSPPRIVADVFYEDDGDTIWLSDVAMEWVVNLKEAQQDGFEDWEELIEHIGLKWIIASHFTGFYILETDFIDSTIRESILANPDCFEALVTWMAPTVSELLKRFDASEKQIIREGIVHLLDYLHNGDYERDLEYERLAGPVEIGFAIEYAPLDYVIIDGEIYKGLEYKPYRDDEVQLFVVLHQYGVGKERFEQLLQNVLDIINQ